MRNKVILVIVLAAITIGGGTAVLAGRGPGGDLGPEMGAGGFVMRMSKVLRLTDEQQTQVKSILSSERTVAEPLLEQMHEKRKHLMQTGETASFDEAAVRNIAAAISGIEVELAVLRVRTETAIFSLLTPDQRETYKGLRHDMDRLPRRPME